MCYLPTDLPTENQTKSINKNFTDDITNGHDLLVRYVFVIKKMNITEEKAYPSVLKIASIIIASETVIDEIKPTNYL